MAMENPWHGCYRCSDIFGFMEAFGMGKDLSEMTLEELWELFPIFLVAHDDRWKANYNEIEKYVQFKFVSEVVK